MVALKLLTISEETESFRRQVIPRKRLKKYLDKNMARIPEGKREELAAVLMAEKLEAGGM